MSSGISQSLGIQGVSRHSLCTASSPSWPYTEADITEIVLGLGRQGERLLGSRYSSLLWALMSSRLKQEGTEKIAGRNQRQRIKQSDKRWWRRNGDRQMLNREETERTTQKGNSKREMWWTAKNPKCCCLQKTLAGASWRFYLDSMFSWMWKPRFREHKALAEGHKASKWWVQDSNLDLTDSTPFHSLCRGSQWSRDWWMEKEHNEQVDRWEENILLHSKKTTNFYNLREKRE